MKRKNVRYDELKVGDIILFHGANVKVASIHTTPAPANEYYPNEKTIDFSVEPADEDAEKILGEFYAHGNYGGIGCLTTTLIERR